MSEGNGSNLQALIDATASGRLLGEISLVISNRLHAKGLQRAENAGIPTVYLNLIPYSKRFPTSDPSIKYGSEAREAYDTDLASKVLQVKPDMVVCAGEWIRISNSLVCSPSGRMVRGPHGTHSRRYD